MSIHEKVNAAQLLCAALDGAFQAVRAPHVNGADAEDFRAWPCRRDVLGHSLCLLHVPPDYARVCAKVDEGADLRGTDGPVAASAEDDLVICAWCR